MLPDGTVVLVVLVVVVVLRLVPAGAVGVASTGEVIAEV
jgi:hypothetical protein